MSGLYKGKYRSDSARLKNWDYRWHAAYFITICTRDREHYFGSIANGKMLLSPVGAIAHVLWHEMKFRLPYIELGEFVVMPNHVHAILILDVHMDADDNKRGDVACNVPTPITVPTTITEAMTNPENSNIEMSEISPKTGSVSTIIRSYKSAVTKYCNRLELLFGWQSRFHDHIIRNDQSFQYISEYIRNNPARWDEDRLKYKDLGV